MRINGTTVLKKSGLTAWAIKDKFSGEDNKDINATPSSCYDQLLNELARAKYFPPLYYC